MANFNLPCELELNIYEELLPRGPRFARIGGPNFLADIHPRDQSNATNLLFAQLPNPQLPRTLDLALGRTIPTLAEVGRPLAFQRHDHPGPQDIIAMADMTDEVQQTLHPRDSREARGFLECFAGWAQIPGLQLPDVFFVRPTEL